MDTNATFHLDGQTPLEGRVDVRHDESGRYDWSGSVPVALPLGDRVDVLFETSGSFFVGRALVKSVVSSDGADTTHLVGTAAR